MTGVAEHDGDAMCAGVHLAECEGGVAEYVRDAVIMEGDRLTDCGQVTVEEHVVVIPCRRKRSDEAPGDGHVAAREHFAASGRDDLEPRTTVARRRK